MPISQSEREKLRAHTFSEDKEGEFGGTHKVAPEISENDMIGHSLGLLASRPSALALNVPGSAAFALYALAAFGTASAATFIFYASAFFAFGILIAAPLSSLAKARLSGMEAPGVVDSMIMSLAYAEPLVAASYVALIALAFRDAAGFTLLSAITFIVLLAVAFLLHIANLDSSISVQMAGGKKYGRSTAMNNSWMFLSGQSMAMLAANIVSYLPLIALVPLDALFSGTALMPYLAVLTFIFADICASWWQACTSVAYGIVAKKTKPMKYSRL